MSSPSRINLQIMCLTLMSFIAALLLSHQVMAVDATGYHYQIEVRESQQAPYLKVSLALELMATASTLDLHIPHRWGTSTIANSALRNIEITNTACNQLVDQIDSVGDIENLHIDISGCDKKFLRIDYELHQTHPKINIAEGQNRYVPTINTSFIRLLVGMGLMVPTHQEHISATVNWKDTPSDSVVLSGLKSQDNLFTYSGSLAGFYRQIFYVTQKDQVSIYPLAGNTTLVVDNDIKIPANTLVNGLARSINAVQSALQQPSATHLILVTHLTSDTGVSSLDGLALDNTFWLQLTDDIPAEQLHLVYLHELLHELIPGTMGLASVRFPNLQWFVEGFTEYLAFSLAVRGDIIDKSRMVDEINRVILSLSTSTLASLSPEEYSQVYMEPLPWLGSIDTLTRIPYWKGFLLALKWDNDIQQRCDTCSLLNAVNDLAKEDIKQDFPYIGPERIIYVMRQYGLTDPARDIDQFIIHNQGPALITSRAQANQALKNIQVESFDFGFAYPLSTNDGFNVKNVDMQSNAYKAGVRNGMTIRSASFHFGKPNHPLTLAVNELVNPIEYLPKRIINVELVDKNALPPQLTR